MNIDIIKILFPSFLTFTIGILITPFFTHYFYKYKMWKKSARTLADTSDEFNKVHNTSAEISTPRVGGIIIWSSVIICTLIIFLISLIFPNDLSAKLNFLDRGQTLIPFATLIFASLIGLTDDYFQISGTSNYAKDGLVYRKVKISALVIIGLMIGSWFYFKLDMHSIHIPFLGEFILGALFIPFFVLVMLATFSTSVIDGMDGLAGGVMACIFTAYSVIAYAHGQVNIAVFCAVLASADLAFLWFNIPPARFYMGENGILGLTVTLSVIAFLTNTVFILPLIALPLVATTASVILQIFVYKNFNKKRIFRVAPLHHHFESLGWTREKIVMRYWVISVMSAILGTILALVS